MYYGLIMPVVYTGGVYIRSVSQTKESTESGGVNEITFTLTNGRKTAVLVRNGGEAPVDDELDPDSPNPISNRAACSGFVRVRDSLTEEQLAELLASLKTN